MMKAKKYDWKDSNLALFGSDTEKQVKKESAETEPAWKGAGQSVGLQVWRVVQFKIEHWPKEDYGQFFSGDSYIILNTYKDPDSDALNYDVHFWIGKYSTQDEYGTAAYKTVELDTLLDDKPIQHREVQGHESNLFKSYFPCMTYMEGGADTGFRRVLPEEYKPRLFHFKKVAKTRRIVMNQIKLSRSKLDTNDVFVLDTADYIYLWVGSECSKDEAFKARQHVQTIKESRNGRVRDETLDEATTSASHPFYDCLDSGDDDDEDDSDDYSAEGDYESQMLRYSDADGELQLDPVDYSKDSLTSDDVYLVDHKDCLFVWVGKGASIDERKNALSRGSNYLLKTDHPCANITVVGEGKETKAFNNALAMAA